MALGLELSSSDDRLEVELERFSSPVCCDSEKSLMSLLNGESSIFRKDVVLIGLWLSDIRLLELKKKELKQDQLSVKMTKDKKDTKLKPCCACPSTRQSRDECVLMKGEENCGELIEQHLQCMLALGFDMKSRK